MAQENTRESQFQDTPAGWAARLAEEFKAARKALADFHKQADDALTAYWGEDGRGAKWNIFTADTQTKEAILYGNPPKARCSRRYADPNDDLARVGALIQERLLNADLEGDDDTLIEAIGYAHKEREVPGLGVVRVRYEAGELEEIPGKPPMVHPQTGVQLAPAVPPVQTRPNERVETDWVHFKDYLWSPCRVWHEVTWMAFAGDMSFADVEKKFGKEVANSVEFKANGQKQSDRDEKARSPWDRCRVWEVWEKSQKQLLYYVEGHDVVLTPVGMEALPSGGIKDPLGLPGFWPCPRPMFANLTTSKLVPKPDREFAKDAYDAINNLTRRINLLEKAIKVAGVYDSSATGLRKLLDDGAENELVPVENWAMFAEKGGLRGAIDWLPLDQVVNALMQLRQARMEAIEGARQLTGMADIMRGGTDEPGATATEVRAKSRYGSVRMRQREKELARFVTDLHRLRAQVMALHFDESTYLQRCNCEMTQDAQLAPEAVKLLKSDIAKWRIEVSPETISITDFDAIQQERGQTTAAIAQTTTALAPLAQSMPGVLPLMLEYLKWVVSGTRGAAEIEGTLDKAIASAQQQAAQPQPQQQPDPKLIAQQMKGQQDMEKIQADLQADLVREQAKVQADAQREQTQAIWNTREAAMKAQITAAHRPPQPMGQKPQGGTGGGLP